MAEMSAQGIRLAQAEPEVAHFEPQPVKKMRRGLLNG
jgi:hypothetical protein